MGWNRQIFYFLIINNKGGIYMEIIGLKKFIVENKTIEVKNYSEMCNLLNEEKTTGLGKINQLERWKLYFEFVQQGHKFIVIKIYDDETIAKNVLEYETNKTMNKAYSYSEYTKYLMPVILFLLACEKHNEILMTQAEVARDCGFFNEEIEGKSSYSNYIGYRNEMKEKYKDKVFFKNDMKRFTYHTFLGELKRDAYSKILTALKNLKKLNVLEYDVGNVGIRDDDDEKKILTYSENEKYKECRDRACEKITPAYNELYKVEKARVTEDDIRYHFEIQPLFYSTLNEIVKRNLDFNIVLKHIHITLLDNDYMKNLPNGIYNYEQYEEYIRKINKLVVKTVQNRINNDISKKMKSYIQEKIYIMASNGYTIKETGEFIEPVGYARLTNDNTAKTKIRRMKTTKNGFTMEEQMTEEIKYYNKAEMINLLVSYEPDIEVIDLNELEKQCFEYYYELENDMDEETKAKIQEIFKAFGV